MRKVITWIFIFAFYFNGNAKIWYVDNNTPFNSGNFSTAQAAHDAATVLDGDTLYFVPSGTNYGSITLTKRLVIIGGGYWLSSNNIAHLYKAQNSVLSNIVYAASAAGSYLCGITASRCVLYGNSITIDRCNINNTSIDTAIVVRANNCLIQRSYIQWGGWSQGSIIRIADTAINCTIRNNIFKDITNGSIIGVCFFYNAVVYNNVFHAGNISFYLTVAENNIFYNSSYIGISNSNLGYNISGNGSVLPGLGNIASTWSSFFVATGAPDAYYKLKADSPAKGVGFGGIDCGAFAGSTPYILSGLPDIPIITNFLAAPVVTSTSGLPITVRVKAVP